MCRGGVVGRQVISFFGVAELLPDAGGEELDEIDGWLADLEDGDGPRPGPEDLDWLWDRIVDLAGGSMSVEIDREARWLLGEVAALGDDLSASDDGADAVPTGLRVHLRSLGRHPAGEWEAVLLADLFDNAWSTYESWSQLDPDAAAGEFAGRVEEIAATAMALARSTRSPVVQRMLASTRAAVAFRQGDLDGAIGLVEEFFVLARQTSRQSDGAPSLHELVMVALAGVNAHAVRGDADAVSEVMRRVRVYGEPAGENLPAVLMEIWSLALLNLDPGFAQMLARQVLIDEQTVTGEHSDESMRAAFALLMASVAVGDEDTAERLAHEWVPVAFEAGSGLGARLWMDAAHTDDSGAPGDDS